MAIFLRQYYYMSIFLYNIFFIAVKLKIATRRAADEPLLEFRVDHAVGESLAANPDPLQDSVTLELMQD